MTLPTTYATFDLLEESGGDRVAQRSSTMSGERGGPAFARSIGPRQRRRYTVPLNQARPVEVARLSDLWNLTGFGVLPMLFTHDKDGTMAVVFDQDQLEWVQARRTSASFDVKLVEWFA